MHPPVQTAVGQLLNAVTPLFTQWWFYVILVVVAAVVWWLFFSPDPKIKASPEYPIDDEAAGDLAVGYLQIRNTNSGYWNDPTAGELIEGAKRRLSDMWGLSTREDWEENIHRLTTQRRRRDLWEQYLEVRRSLSNGGAAPADKAWLKALIDAGADKRDAKMFVASVTFAEASVRKEVGSKFIERSVWVRSFDGYALGQAVAITTWGVAMGHATVDEARKVISEISGLARGAFSSWQEFGMSYAVGRAMHWEDGAIQEQTWDRKYADATRHMKNALNPGQNGPWASVPWRR